MVSFRRFCDCQKSGSAAFPITIVAALMLIAGCEQIQDAANDVTETVGEQVESVSETVEQQVESVADSAAAVVPV